jgi:dipeptidyl aminopeptidase/acylaminoacyl peptidase
MRTASVLLALSLLCACAPRKAGPASAAPRPGFKSLAELRDVPGLGEPRRIEPGVLFHEVVLPREQATRRLWVYLPERAGAGRLPCVFVAPAGSNLLTGNELGEGDRPEHLPYVRAGFAVVAYELDGPLRQGEQPTDREITEAYEAFRAAEAGVANARMAMDYALAKIPQVDPERFYVAGHSSAATLALLVAEREPRVKACAAYAPVTDVATHFGPRAVRQLSVLPGFGDFVRDYSPINGAERLTVPLFLFSADDDSNVPPEQSARFAAAVGKVNRDVTYVRVPTGNHYDSMIVEGVPRAIEWLQGLGQPERKR